jgi:hypothetical protein
MTTIEVVALNAGGAGGAGGVDSGRLGPGALVATGSTTEIGSTAAVAGSLVVEAVATDMGAGSLAAV